MAKQDVLDAINSTIVSNNIKGITADSLSNVLTLMTENAGSGSGEGALRVMIPDPGEMSGTESEEIHFNLEYYETYVKPEMDVIAPGLGDRMAAFFEEMFAYNAEAYTQILEKAQKFEGMMCLLDASMCSKILVGAVLELSGFEVELTAGTLSYLATINGGFYEPEMPDQPNEFLLIPLLDSSGDSYSDFKEIVLQPDGTLIFRYKANVIDYISVPAPDSSWQLSDTQKANNLAASSSDVKEIRFVSSDNGSTLPAPRVVSRSYNEYDYFYELELKRATVASDGTVTITTLGTLNAPTA
jgi:hypothetical protein